MATLSAVEYQQMGSKLDVSFPELLKPEAADLAATAKPTCPSKSHTMPIKLVKPVIQQMESPFIM